MEYWISWQKILYWESSWNLWQALSPEYSPFCGPAGLHFHQAWRCYHVIRINVKATLFNLIGTWMLSTVSTLQLCSSSSLMAVISYPGIRPVRTTVCVCQKRPLFLFTCLFVCTFLLSISRRLVSPEATGAMLLCQDGLRKGKVHRKKKNRSGQVSSNNGSLIQQ